jgi:hypothetical protein
MYTITCHRCGTRQDPQPCEICPACVVSPDTCNPPRHAGLADTPALLPSEHIGIAATALATGLLFITKTYQHPLNDKNDCVESIN